MMEEAVKESKGENARVDSPLEIELKAAGTSGYEWRPHFDTSEFRLIGSRRVINRRSMGGSGKIIFKFRPLMRGRHAIRFDLIRPWETVPAEQEEFNFTVL